MLILSLVRQKQHLTKLIFDNGEEALLDNDICINSGLKPQMQISEGELEDLKYTSDYERAKNRALWYLDRSDRTEKAMYEKLLTAGFPKKASAAVIARLVEVGLIDDRRFAIRFAEKCIESNISKREAVRKMLSKGVPYDIIKDTISETEVDEEEQAANILRKKYLNKLTQENGYEKVYAALIRRGFSYSAVRNVLKNYCEETDYSEEY